MEQPIAQPAIADDDQSGMRDDVDGRARKNRCVMRATIAPR